MPKPLRLSPLHFAPNAIFLHRILSRMHFLCMYVADTFTLFSIVFCLKCLFSILFPQKKRLSILPKFSSLSPLYLTPNAIVLHSILPRMHFLCMYFAITFTLSQLSIALCPKCNFSPSYFAMQFVTMNLRPRRPGCGAARIEKPRTAAKCIDGLS